MEKRTILAFLLMALVLAVSQYLFVPPKPPPGEPDGGQPGAGNGAGLGPAVGEDGAPSGGTARGTPDPAAADGDDPNEGAPGGDASLEDDSRSAPGSMTGDAIADYAAPGGAAVRVQTPLYRLTFDRRGGVVTQAYLERYPSFVDDSSVQIVPPGQAWLQRTVRAEERALELTDLTFEAGRENLRVTDAPDSLVLTAELPGGGSVRQVYRFDPLTYDVGYRLDASGLGVDGGELVTRLGPRLRSTEKSMEEDLGSFAAVASVGDEVHTLQPKNLEDGPETFRGSARWAGIKSKYFLGALVATGEPFDTVRIARVPSDSLPGLAVSAGIPLEGGEAAHSIYLGPQEYRALEAAGGGLEDVNQYGWSWIRWLIQPFAHVIVRILLWMHGIVPNYGVVLIIFGVLVRLIMWPLTQKSFVSMQKMQAIQPELTRLKERYKKDPQRLQAEMMRMYKERGVNPLGGCLPNLLPLPVLFALFFVFQNTIEFRGAPFVAWIEDLSRPDPWYVLPVLMGATMFVQQKMTAVGDNPQMKMMIYFMPVFLTFIFLNLAAGLVLYYTVQNVLTFVQQILLKRRSEAGAGAPLPAAKS